MLRDALVAATTAETRKLRLFASLLRRSFSVTYLSGDTFNLDLAELLPCNLDALLLQRLAQLLQKYLPNFGAGEKGCIQISKDSETS